MEKHLFRQLKSWPSKAFTAIMNSLKDRGRWLRDCVLKVLTFLSWLLLLVILIALISAIIIIIADLTMPINLDDIFKDTLHLSKWDWIAGGIAGISLLYACLTFNSQKQTEENTMKITPESQRKLLIDYARHFYCNLIITCAIEKKLNNRFDEYYPSEEHLLKLKVDLDALHPAAFFTQSDKYEALHELMVKARNYNIEIDVAMAHLCNPMVFDKAKKRDFATMKFKMSFLTEEIITTLNKMWNNQTEKNRTDVKELLSDTAANRNKKIFYNTNNDSKISNVQLLNEARAYFKNNKIVCPTYYKNEESFFAKGKKGNGLFCTQAESDTFFEWLNYNIYFELTGSNSEKSDKILLIPFDKNSNED